MKERRGQVLAINIFPPTPPPHGPSPRIQSPGPPPSHEPDPCAPPHLPRRQRSHLGPAGPGRTQQSVPETVRAVTDRLPWCEFFVPGGKGEGSLFPALTKSAKW